MRAETRVIKRINIEKNEELHDNFLLLIFHFFIRSAAFRV